MGRRRRPALDLIHVDNVEATVGPRVLWVTMNSPQASPDDKPANASQAVDADPQLAGLHSGSGAAADLIQARLQCHSVELERKADENLDTTAQAAGETPEAEGNARVRRL